MMDPSVVVRTIPTLEPLPFNAPSTFRIHPSKIALRWKSWCELGKEVRQDLPFGRCSRLEGDSEGSDLCPLHDYTIGLRVLHNGPQRVLCQHDDGEELKLVLQLLVVSKSEH